MTSYGCGFCLRGVEDLVEAKVLPCKHIHCTDCLSSDYTIHHAVQCPLSTCRQAFDMTVDTLPTVGKAEQDVSLDAQIKEKITTCTLHLGEPFAKACVNCHAIFCAKCSPKTSKCALDDSHSTMQLDLLIEEKLKEKSEQAVTEIIAREKAFESMFKSCSKFLAEHQEKTCNMLQTVNLTQQQSGDQRFDKLKEELKVKRESSAVAISKFMEEEVLPRWSLLSNQRNSIECSFRLSQVDFVSQYNERMIKAKELIDEELPELIINDLVELKTADNQADVMFEIVPCDDAVIDSEYGLCTYYPMPQSIALLKAVKVSAPPISLCYHLGIIYVGLCNGTISKIDEEYEVQDSFITCPGQVESILVHKDKIYTLVLPNTGMVHKVCVYDLSGNLERDWRHSCDISYFCNAMTLLSDQLIIADQPNRRVTVYSLEGEVIKHLPCAQIEGIAGGITQPVDSSSVVMSRNNNVTEAFRLDLNSGQVVWSCGDVRRPESIASYGWKYVLVSDCRKSIKIINIKTGAVIGELRDETVSEYEYIYGLEAFDKTLVAAQYISVNVVFCKLNF